MLLLILSFRCLQGYPPLPLNIILYLIINSLEVLLRLVGISDHGLVAGLPSSGADLSVFISVLERLDQTQSLVHTATHGQVIDGHLTQILLVIDDEEATEGNARLLIQHSVSPAHLHGLVREQGNIHGTQTALLTRLVDPRQVSKVRVSGHTNDLAADGTELSGTITERDDLGGTHKGAGRRMGRGYYYNFEFIRHLSLST